MINEVLYMQVRLLREFAEKYNLDVGEVNDIFEKYRIFNYIRDCYDVLHMNGDEYIISDIYEILSNKGVNIC